MFRHHMVPSSGSAICTSTGGKKAEDQATELNLGPAVGSVQVALPEDGVIGCRNM
jgi:hypothetical protein